MKNLFIINEEEKNRILNLHETATNRHYLSEQQTTGYVTQLTESDLKKSIKKGLLMEDDEPLPDMENVPLWKVKAVQQALVDAGYNVGPKGVNGIFDKYTRMAVLKYQKDNGIRQTGNVGPITSKRLGVQQLTSGKPLKKTSGFILVWAFPEYEPKIDGKGKLMQFFGSLIRLSSGGGTKGTYGKLGHGGCVIVTPDGNATCYEFGRYPGAKKGYGKVLKHPLGKVAKIKDGQLINPKQVSKLAREKTFPPGPTMSMSVAVVKLPNPSGAIDYASVKQREYTALDFSIGDEDANCGTFTQDVAKSGGINVGSFCYPTPIAAVNSFKNKSDSFFQI
jgi:peptidoglycan hydrolase-like protein with peptidoglycan-binding domain